jgi:hypothetical protein
MIFEYKIFLIKNLGKNVYESVYISLGMRNNTETYYL